MRIKSMIDERDEARNEDVKFVQLDLGYELPSQLQKDIDALEEGVKNHVSYIDCLQDEVRSSSRYLDDDDDMNRIIDYYCRRRYR